jgi:hypothetical protein
VLTAEHQDRVADLRDQGRDHPTQQQRPRLVRHVQQLAERLDVARGVRQRQLHGQRGAAEDDR